MSVTRPARPSERPIIQRRAQQMSSAKILGDLLDSWWKVHGTRRLCSEIANITDEWRNQRPTLISLRDRLSLPLQAPEKKHVVGHRFEP